MQIKRFLVFLVLSAMVSMLHAQGYHRAEVLRKRYTEKIQQILQDSLFVIETDAEDTMEYPNYQSDNEEETDFKVFPNPYPESEVHAVINPTDSNNIVLSPIMNKGSLKVPIYFTRDFGRTWKISRYQARAPGNNTIIGGGDPMFAFDADGRLYFSWINLFLKPLAFEMGWGMYWAYSDDGGKNWEQIGDGIVAYNNISTTMSSGIAYDKQWMAADKSNSIWRNNLYLVMVEIDMLSLESTIVVRKKAPGNVGFEQISIPVSDNSFTEVQFSCIDVDNKGHVHVTFWGSKNDVVYSLWHSISKDGGNSFETPVKISDIHMPENITGISNDRLYPCPVMVVDKESPLMSDNIYITWTADGISNSEGLGANIYFSKSEDNGQSWSGPQMLKNSNGDFSGDQFYSSISVNPHGQIFVNFYDAWKDQANKIVHYVICSSDNGGTGFGETTKITSGHTDFTTVGSQNAGFGIGEYNQTLSTPGHVIPIWSDGRTLDGGLNIYAAFLETKNGTVGKKEIIPVSEHMSITNIYPNPLDNELKLDIDLQRTTDMYLSIYASDGKLMYRKEFKNLIAGNHVIITDTQKLESGLYLLQLQSNFGSYSTEFIKK